VDPRIGEQARARLHETFAALCRIASPTGHERPCADWIARELDAIGLTVAEDEAGAAVGADAGNLLARIDGRGPGWLLLCAHMDTVPLAAAVEPVLRDGVWENAADGILGADNKAAVAALVELARLFARPGADPPPVGVELLFTVSEETGLHGAKAFDVGRLHSEFGYVLDHASPVGEIVVASPTHMRIVARIRGRAAHAGLQPELGRNAIVAAARAVVAMPQGRLDPETTANVGLISGGTASNVVAEHCRVEAEVRGIDQARVDEVVTRVVDALQEAADASACDLDLDLERMFAGYRLRPAEPAVELAARALRAIGYVPRPITSGGGSDANALRAAGFACVNLANGTQHAHQPSECVSAEALEAGLALVLALVDQAAAAQTEAAA
jgi:tripeptide aminopeptidase